jgi:hypothetical protein
LAQKNRQLNAIRPSVNLVNDMAAPNFGKVKEPSESDIGAEVRKPWQTRKRIWTGLVLGMLAVSYMLAGLYLAPRWFRSAATAWVKTNLNQSLAVGEIKFNPLTFTLDVDDVAIPDNAKPIVILEAQMTSAFEVRSGNGLAP